MVIVSGEDAAGADFVPPLAQGFAAFVALMGVAVDIGKVEAGVVEQGEGFGAQGAQVWVDDFFIARYPNEE